MKKIILFIVFSAVIIAQAGEHAVMKTEFAKRSYHKARRICREEWDRGRSGVVSADMLSLEEAFSRWQENYEQYRESGDMEVILSCVRLANYYNRKIYKFYCPAAPGERLPLLDVPGRE